MAGWGRMAFRLLASMAVDRDQGREAIMGGSFGGCGADCLGYGMAMASW